MPAYSYRITTNASSEKKTTVNLKGDYLTKVMIRFPPGPMGLLHVRIFYGDYQLFPEDKDTDFADDDLAIEWEEFWELPEKPCPITIYTLNEDDTYAHAVHIYLFTKYKQEMLAEQIAMRLRALLGGVIKALGTIFRW